MLYLSQYNMYVCTHLYTQTHEQSHVIEEPTDTIDQYHIIIYFHYVQKHTMKRK